MDLHNIMDMVNITLLRSLDGAGADPNQLEAQIRRAQGLFLEERDARDGVGCF